MNKSTGKLTLANMKSAWDMIEKNGTAPDMVYVDPSTHRLIVNAFTPAKEITYEEMGLKEKYDVLKSFRKSSIDDYEDLVDKIRYNTAMYGTSVIKLHGKLTGITGV